MTNQVKQAFSPEVIKLQVEQILPLRKIEPSVKKTKKYRQIAASIAEVGVIEHMVVHAQPNMPDKFMLLDGHLRLARGRDAKPWGSLRRAPEPGARSLQPIQPWGGCCFGLRPVARVFRFLACREAGTGDERARDRRFDARRFGTQSSVGQQELYRDDTRGVGRRLRRNPAIRPNPSIPLQSARVNISSHRRNHRRSRATGRPSSCFSCSWSS